MKQARVICGGVLLLLLCAATQAQAPAAPAAAQDQPLKREAHTPEDQFRFAEGLLLRKFYDMGEEEFRQFCTNFPDHPLAPKAMLRLIECLRCQNKIDATISAINQFQARWPDNELTPKLFLWKGELLLQNSQLPEAASCFKRLLVAADTVVQEAAVYFLAQCYAKEGNTAQALDAYAKIGAQPFDAEHLYRPYAAFALAMAAQAKGDFAVAEKGFSRLRDDKTVPGALREESIYRLAENSFLRSDFSKAIAMYELLLGDYPDGGFGREARKRRAWAFLCLKDFGKAAEQAADWRKRYGAIADYEMDYIQGASLAGAGFCAEALPLFAKLASGGTVPPDYVKLARYQEVLCLLRGEKYPEALAKAAAFFNDYPKAAEVADVHFFAGEAHFRSNAPGEAAAELQKAIDTSVGDWPYYTEVQLRLAECLLRAGKAADAANMYRTLAANPRIKEKALALIHAGECERTAGNWEAAVADFEGVLAKFPTRDSEVKLALMNLGELYAEKQQFDRAVKLVNELMARKDIGGKAYLVFFLGYLRYRQGNYAEAEKYLREAIAMKDNGKVVNSAKHYLAGSLLELKREDEGLNLFAELVALPADQRPALPASLLLRLEELFFARNRYDVSETICRWLMGWKDPAVVYQGTLRYAEMLIAQNRLGDAQQLLGELLTKAAAGQAGQPEGSAGEEVLAALGEVHLLRGENDRAVSAFERALARSGLKPEFAVRARWGLAEILRREKKYNQALHYAINAFVLADDPTYTPRAMFIAVQILLEQGKVDEARTTWQELRTRFPAFAEQRRQDPSIGLLLQAPAAGGEKAVPKP